MVCKVWGTSRECRDAHAAHSKRKKGCRSLLKISSNDMPNGMAARGKGRIDLRLGRLRAAAHSSAAQARRAESRSPCRVQCSVGCPCPRLLLLRGSPLLALTMLSKAPAARSSATLGLARVGAMLGARWRRSRRTKGGGIRLL